MLHNPDKKVDVVVEESKQIKEPGTQVSSEEVKLAQGESEQATFSQRNISTTVEETTTGSLTLLAWCSRRTNKIDIVDLNTKESYASFEGVRISDTGNSWTQLKEIPNTKLLASLHHNYNNPANMAAFDLSKKDHIKEICSLGEVSGGTGQGDFTYNSRRSIFGAVPLYGRFSYHLFNVDSNASKTKDIVKLIRKSKWHSQHKDEISGLDFNPTGEYIATIDKNGVCLISDVTTVNYEFHRGLGHWDSWGCCRWSTNADESSIFVKYDFRQLNTLDAEKKTLTLKSSVELDKGVAFCIDVCQNDGNLLASGGQDKNIQIFDKRESKIIKTFCNVHSNYIHCVRWSPSGDKLASASSDNTVKLLDFKTGKVLYTGKTSDKNPAMSVCFI